MFKLKVSLALVLFSILSTFSQENLNDYKYVIIPSQYDFQKSEDSFQINSLMKFLFEKIDIEVYMDTDEFPEELAKNRCLGLTARLNDLSKMLVTKMNIDLIDCQNKVVYSTAEGKSKVKDYKKAYHESIREAFSEFDELEYAYNGDKAVVAVSGVVAMENTKDSDVLKESVDSNVNSITKESVVAVTTVAAAATVKPSKEEAVAEITVGTTVLYAQPTADGYQLVDSTPKVIYVLTRTTVKDMYLIKGQDGMVYKEGETWKVDYYVDGKLVTKELSLKFF